MSGGFDSLHIVAIAVGGLGAAYASVHAMRWQAAPSPGNADWINLNKGAIWGASWAGAGAATSAAALIAASPGDGDAAIALAGFLIGLLFLAIVDARTMLIPVTATLIWLVGGLLFAAWRGALVEAVGAAFFAGGGLWAIAYAYRAIRGREGLGAGDALVLAGIAAWLGLEGAVMSMTIGALALICYVCARARSAKDLTLIATPFVPGLAIGAAIYLLLRGLG